MGGNDETAPVICIFCGSEGSHQSVAHVVPESLGGRNAPIGRPGVTCDACNQYFGQKVERKGLQSFPFVSYRVLAGVPSKKGAMPSMDATIGAIRGSGTPGIVELDPRTEELGKLVAAGVVTQTRVIAEVTEPLAVARMLLKIGLEELGKHFYEVAISERVSEARSFARRPKRGEGWWFVLRSCPEEYIPDPGSRECLIEIFEREGILISAMHMLGVSTMIPLERRALPPMQGDLPEPEYRTVVAVC